MNDEEDEGPCKEKTQLIIIKNLFTLEESLKVCGMVVQDVWLIIFSFPLLLVLSCNIYFVLLTLQDYELIKDIKDDIKDACEPHGETTKFTLYEVGQILGRGQCHHISQQNHPEGVISLKYSTVRAGEKLIAALNGKMYNGGWLRTQSKCLNVWRFSLSLPLTYSQGIFLMLDTGTKRLIIEFVALHWQEQLFCIYFLYNAT